MTDFPLDDDFNQMLSAAPRAGLPADEQLTRIRNTVPSIMVSCTRCGGTGRFGSYGTCFKCQGSGKQRGQQFKNSPEVRAANREKVQARGLRRFNSNWDDFKGEYPARATWIEANPDFDFARDMKAKIGQYGHLTEAQGLAIDRMIARAAEKAAQRVTAARSAAPLSFPNIRAAFDAVVARGAKRAQITVGDVNLSLAQAGGRNPGALYVKDAGEYAGKIVGTRFFPARDIKADLVARLVEVERDPTGAVKAQAAKTAEMLAQAEAEGRKLELPCGCCGLTLTDPVSIARGIGPWCAAKWNF